jgi:prefoldin subunit 4
LLIGLPSSQLSKEDEAATGGEETEVRREDQEKINRFSRLHQREALLEEQLKAKQVCTVQYRHPRPFPGLGVISTHCVYLIQRQKDKEDLEEISMELEIMDEDELVPYVLSS